MDVRRLAELTRDQLTVSRVFGEPIERGRVTIVPVARVMGGAGGGEGADDSGGGEGGGWAALARPAGVYVIDGEQVRWRPAIDADRALATAAIVVVSLMVLRRVRRGAA